MNRTELQNILGCYQQLERSIINAELIDMVYEYLPNKQSPCFQRVKIQAINRFVITNQPLINEILSSEDPVEIPEPMETPKAPKSRATAKKKIKKHQTTKK